MPTKKEVRTKKREDFRELMTQGTMRQFHKAHKEDVERQLEKAKSYLKSSKLSDAAGAYELAAGKSAGIGDFRSAATYFAKAKNIYHSLAEDSPNRYVVAGDKLSYWKREKAMDEYAHAMRHEAARQKVRSKKSLLERLFSVIVAITIASFLGAIYFLSPNLTGNVIGVSNVYSNWIGGILFIVGLVGVFIYFKFKNH